MKPRFLRYSKPHSTPHTTFDSPFNFLLIPHQPLVGIRNFSTHPPTTATRYSAHAFARLGGIVRWPARSRSFSCSRSIDGYRACFCNGARPARNERAASPHNAARVSTTRLLSFTVDPFFRRLGPIKRRPHELPWWWWWERRTGAWMGIDWMGVRKCLGVLGGWGMRAFLLFLVSFWLVGVEWKFWSFWIKRSECVFLFTLSWYFSFIYGLINVNFISVVVRKKSITCHSKKFSRYFSNTDRGCAPPKGCARTKLASGTYVNVGKNQISNLNPYAFVYIKLRAVTSFLKLSKFITSNFLKFKDIFNS